MKRCKMAGVAGAISGLVSVAALSLWAADPARRAPQLDPTGPPSETVETGLDPAGQDDAQKLQSSFNRLELLSAEAYLKLTELDLKKIDEMNQRMRGLYSDAEVDRFKAGVEIAKARARAAREVAEGKHETAVVGIGQAELKSAQQSYERALHVNRQLPGTMGTTDLDRLKIGVELARLNLEKAKIISQLDSPVFTLKWELDEMREQVRQLQFRITAITARR